MTGVIMVATTNSVDHERRTQYRLNDDVYLEYLVLTDEDVEIAIREFNSQAQQHFNPINQLQAIAVRHCGVLDKIRTTSPDVAEYLSSIDEKIQLLAHAIAQDQVGAPIVPNERVTISTGGVSYSSEQSLAIGALVELSIIIVPSYVHISALGAVVYCHREDKTDLGYPYRIGVEFSHIHEADREALFTHINEKKKKE